MIEGSFDSDIDETPATPIADQDPENFCNDHSVAVAKTVTVSVFSISSDEITSVDLRSNSSAATTRDFEVDVDKGSSNSDIDETSAKPDAQECSENQDDGYDGEQINNKDFIRKHIVFYHLQISHNKS